MDIADICTRSVEFGQDLDRLKKSKPDVSWYPFNSLANVAIIGKLLTGTDHDLFGNLPRPWVLDVGAGDGDVGFLFEALGCHVDMLDNPQTNFNDCHGIRQLQRLLGSNVQLIEQDVDFFFRPRADI